MRLDGQQIAYYHFERHFGSGGTGDVYLAIDSRTQQQVAIKVLQEEVSAYPSDANRRAEKFRYEAAAIARLKHPHIVISQPFYLHQKDTRRLLLVRPLWLPVAESASLPRDKRHPYHRFRNGARNGNKQFVVRLSAFFHLFI